MQSHPDCIYWLSLGLHIQCYCAFVFFFLSQNEILYEKKKKRRRLRLRRLGKRLPPSNPQDGQPMNDWEKEMRQAK